MTPKKLPVLCERFGVPPFSLLDARQGYWRERKRAWLALGLDRLKGRPAHLIYRDKGPTDVGRRIRGIGQGTSQFDPVLAEMVCRWFTPATGARILDPFAGGSVRGVVAGLLGHRYVGIDLRPEQVAANQAQWRDIRRRARRAPAVAPRWKLGDARDVRRLTRGPYDLVFSCPPYYNLEVYSDRPEDLSRAGTYAAFVEAYRAIVADCCRLLAEDRFACFVVGDVRDRRGLCRQFVPDTIQAFEDAGVRLYNVGIYVTLAGSLPMRVGAQFDAGRKLGRTHQYLLVFYKGDPRRIKPIFGPVRPPSGPPFDLAPRPDPKPRKRRA